MLLTLLCVPQLCESAARNASPGWFAAKVGAGLFRSLDGLDTGGAINGPFLVVSYRVQKGCTAGMGTDKSGTGLLAIQPISFSFLKGGPVQ